jgi:NAD(P)-dependent dehydrogenase (short-subunit alcohol dehydrogenase family)
MTVRLTWFLSLMRTVIVKGTREGFQTRVDAEAGIILVPVEALKIFNDNSVNGQVCCRHSNKLERAKDMRGPLCVAHQLDLTCLEKLPAAVHKLKKEYGRIDILKEYGRIDILVSNAGIHLKKPFAEVSDEELQQIIMTNLTAVFSLSREVSRVMAEKHSGSILHISSMAAKYGIPQVIAYTAAKSGIEGMTRAMAVELSPAGIRVNCIAPGFIQTAMSGGAMDKDPERKRKALSRASMAAFGAPDDVADAACFLTSEEASYITSAVLTVDGGNSIGF